MFKKLSIIMSVVALSVLLSGLAFAHTPLCSCYDNGDGTVTCEGGFSDGSSASGVEMRVEGKNGSVLMKGQMDDYSEFTFDKPSESYSVIFDAGPGHVISITGDDIL